MRRSWKTALSGFLQGRAARGWCELSRPRTDKGSMRTRLVPLAGLVAGSLALAAVGDGFGRAPSQRETAMPARAPSFVASSGSCPVTLPNRTVPPNAGFSAAGFNYGNAYLRAHLWPQGTLVAGILSDGGAMATINPDGSIWAKLGWWRGLPRKLVISGRRLDASAPPLRADVPDGYGTRGFLPTGLTFPTVGCWQVVGKLGRASLTFVVKVRKVKPRAG